MSRRDAKKMMDLHLPDTLRKRLIATSGEALPLAYLVRQALRRAMDSSTGWEEDVTPAAGPPVQLQLTTEERARLDMWTTQRSVTPEVAILSLISATV
ncbi:hypothetical protein [Tropicibacter naphthalenivorans]|uniref:Uncharacterized protein n=1 Tax=Tropicibacter naphthalenivorans TaxID=441103 RepID=A0A0P1GSK6_9RHOB|nr:hypothetical protein [Tropicibacter naphthalenivorans]CUH78655.1 hypothetical protein TRN7648_02094 [Tropicibacter naphthalenivorans]SMC81138.1 hypothetical protein SAMN04488093_104256 [Tropicibacter naphthalenivorans]